MLHQAPGFAIERGDIFPGSGGSGPIELCLNETFERSWAEASSILDNVGALRSPLLYVHARYRVSQLTMVRAHNADKLSRDYP